MPPNNRARQRSAHPKPDTSTARASQAQQEPAPLAESTAQASPAISNLLQQPSFSQRDVVQLQRALGTRKTRAVLARQQATVRRRRVRRKGQDPDDHPPNNQHQQQQPVVQREPAAQPQPGTQQTAKPKVDNSPGAWAWWFSSILFGPLHDAAAYQFYYESEGKKLEDKYDKMVFTRYNHRKDGFGILLGVVNMLASMTEIATGVAGTLSLLSFVLSAIPGLQFLMAAGGWLGEAALVGAVTAFTLRAVMSILHLYDILAIQTSSQGANKSFEMFKQNYLGMFMAALGVGIGAPGSKLFSKVPKTTAQAGLGGAIGAAGGRFGKKAVQEGAKKALGDVAGEGAKKALGQGVKQGGKQALKQTGQAAAGAPGANLVNEGLNKAAASSPPQQDDQPVINKAPADQAAVAPAAMAADPSQIGPTLDAFKAAAEQQKAKAQADKAKVQKARGGIQQGAAKAQKVGEKFGGVKSSVDANQDQLLNAKSAVDSVDKDKAKNVSKQDIKRGEKAKDEAESAMQKEPKTVDEAKAMVERGRSIAEQAKNAPKQKRSWWSRFKSWFYRRIIGPLTRLVGAGKAMLGGLAAKATQFIAKITGLSKLFGLLGDASSADDKRLEYMSEGLTKQEEGLDKAIQGANQGKQKLGQ